MKEAKIIKIAHLIESLVAIFETDKKSNDEKVSLIKQCRDDGYITDDEALELTLEYCTTSFCPHCGAYTR